MSAVSSIGFSKTMTEAFADLRNEQAALSTRAKEIVKMYEELKGKDAEDLEVTTEMQEYCEGREALFDAIREWYKKSGEQIADFQDSRTEGRIKRVHDFFDRIRAMLRVTQPLGINEKENDLDLEWLETKVDNFPEKTVPAARFSAQKQEGWKERLRSGASSALVAMGVSPRRGNGPQRTSTPDSVREGEKKKREKKTKSIREEDREGKEVEGKEEEKVIEEGEREVEAKEAGVEEDNDDDEEGADDDEGEDGDEEDEEEVMRALTEGVEKKLEKWGEGRNGRSMKTLTLLEDKEEGKEEQKEKEEIDLLRASLAKELEGVEDPEVLVAATAVAESVRKAAERKEKAAEERRRKRNAREEKMRKEKEEEEERKEKEKREDARRKEEEEGKRRREAEEKRRREEEAKRRKGERIEELMRRMKEIERELEEKRCELEEDEGEEEDSAKRKEEWKVVGKKRTKKGKKSLRKGEKAGGKGKRTGKEEAGKEEEEEEEGESSDDSGEEEVNQEVKGYHGGEKKAKGETAKGKGKKGKKEEKKKKIIKKKRGTSSSSESDEGEEESSSSEEEEEEEEDEEERKGREEAVKVAEGRKGQKGPKRRSMKELRMETLARERLMEARPKREEEKYGDDGKVNFQAFRNRFNAVAKDRGANPIDILNELPNWLRGTPKYLVEAFLGAEDPEKAVEEIWRQLEEFYALNVLTAAERIQPLIKKGKIEKDDVDALINLMSDLKKIANEARIAGMEKELDRADIVRDVMLGKVPFMADEFYRKEAKKKKKEPTFRMGFQDVVDAVLERAQILKAQGKTSKPAQVARVAAASTNIGVRNYSGVLRNSPPKVQQPLPAKVVCAICQFGHATAACAKFKQLTVEKRLEELRRRGICFNCLSGGHISRLCDQQRSKCGSCGDYHHTLLHVERRTAAGGGGGGRVGGGGNGGNGSGGSFSGTRGGAAATAQPPAAPTTSSRASSEAGGGATGSGGATAAGTGVVNGRAA